jgi:hypothetical protein
MVMRSDFAWASSGEANPHLGQIQASPPRMTLNDQKHITGAHPYTDRPTKARHGPRPGKYGAILVNLPSLQPRGFTLHGGARLWEVRRVPYAMPTYARRPGLGSIVICIHPDRRTVE